MFFSIYFHLTALTFLVLSFLYLTFFYDKVGKIIHLIKKPNSSLNIHKGEISSIGGVLLIISILFFWNIDIIYNNLTYALPVYIFFISFFIIGLLDDYYNIKPLIRILLYALSSYFLILYTDDYLVSHIYFETLDKNLKINFLPIIFTIFCIVFLQNAFNMIDGINGSLLINTLLIIFILIILNINSFEIFIFIILFFLLILNLKNKIFLGNSGSSLISAIIAILLIDHHNQLAKTLSGEKIFLMCFLPTVDMTRLFFKRIIKKQSPFIGDLNHFHHIVLRNYSNFKWISLFCLVYISLYFLTYFINILIVGILSLIIYYALLYKKK